MDFETICFFIIGMLIGSFIMIFITLVPQEILISQEAADDVCKQLTGNEFAIAEDEPNSLYGGKLICLIPSYDETQNIIIKSNQEE